MTRLLLADRHRAETDHNVVACFSCGRTYLYKGRQGELNGRFCSMRCQGWFDAGNPSYEQQRERKIIYRWRDGRPMKMGAHGFLIDCAGCGKQFDSKGLRCCSPDCEHRYRERADNLATMAEVGMEPATKHLCASCSSAIPKWRNGRKVSSATRFCSSKCQKRARKSGLSQNPFLSAETVQNPNNDGGSR
jgi:hypothetical protein